MRFELLGECGEYLHGYIIMEVGFPKKNPSCQYCRMIRYEESLKRFSCRAIPEPNWIFDPFRSRPEWCPVQMNDEE